jgi:hypothetical protein
LVSIPTWMVRVEELVGRVPFAVVVVVLVAR